MVYIIFYIILYNVLYMYMGSYSLDRVDLSPKTRVYCICIRAVTHLTGWILALRPESLSEQMLFNEIM